MFMVDQVMLQAYLVTEKNNYWLIWHANSVSKVSLLAKIVKDKISAS